MAQKIKFNPGAMRHFDHGCMFFPLRSSDPVEVRKTLDMAKRRCHLCNQAWNWILQKQGKELIPFEERISN